LLRCEVHQGLGAVFRARIKADNIGFEDCRLEWEAKIHVPAFFNTSMFLVYYSPTRIRNRGKSEDEFYLHILFAEEYPIVFAKLLKEPVKTGISLGIIYGRHAGSREWSIVNC
jgi:hypothetical protein